MRMKPLVYVAGPYTKGVSTANTKRAIEVADRLLAAGLIPFVPHLSLLWDTVSPKSYEEWMDYDFQVILRCDALLRIPGESAGGDREVVFAKDHGIPVFFDEDALRRSLLSEADAMMEVDDAC